MTSPFPNWLWLSFLSKAGWPQSERRLFLKRYVVPSPVMVAFGRQVGVICRALGVYDPDAAARIVAVYWAGDPPDWSEHAMSTRLDYLDEPDLWCEMAAEIPVEAIDWKVLTGPDSSVVFLQCALSHLWQAACDPVTAYDELLQSLPDADLEMPKPSLITAGQIAIDPGDLPESVADLRDLAHDSLAWYEAEKGVIPPAPAILVDRLHTRRGNAAPPT